MNNTKIFWIALFIITLFSSNPGAQAKKRLTTTTTTTTTTAATDDTTSSSTTDKINNSRWMTAVDAAKAMNSEAFLRELVEQKNAVDKKFFTEPIIVNENNKRRRRRTKNTTTKPNSTEFCESPKKFSIQNGKLFGNDLLLKKDSSSFVTTCEYTAKLWFLQNVSFRFRESVQVQDITKDGSSAVVKCASSYFTRGQWIDCSVVTCVVSTKDSQRTAKKTTSSSLSLLPVSMDIDSQVLINIPLPFIATNSIRKKISSTFQAAANDFFQKSKKK